MTRVRFKCDKLIRDNVPSKLQKKEIVVYQHSMERDEYLKALARKLIEEAHEVVQAQNKDEVTEELADMLELIQTLEREHGISSDDVEKKRLQKRELNGAFDNKIFCSYIEIDEGNPHIQYYIDRPKQYPQF